MPKIQKIFILSATIILVFAFFAVKILNPPQTKSAFTEVSATLSNPRFSYRALVNATVATGEVVIPISGSFTSMNPDITTNHLFPKDEVCFLRTDYAGCKGGQNFAVSSIPTTTSFIISDALTTGLVNTDWVIATASGKMTLSFKTSVVIPLDGKLYIEVPAVNTTGMTDDGYPDWAATSAENGFDFGDIIASDIVTTGSTGCTNWGTPTIQVGDATNDHRVTIPKATDTCPAGSTITVVIGNTNPLINPAPSGSSHTQGVADIYQIQIQSRNASDTVIEEASASVAPVEGVLISATVDETLSFTVAGLGTGTYCGASTTLTTTATSIPWGTLSPTYAVGTHNAAQRLTVSTNAVGGYKVYIEQTDQMGRNGNVCWGLTPGADGFTFSGTPNGICIRDTLCGATPCTHTTYQDWGADPSSYPGLGYSLGNQTGTDAKFLYNDGAATFNTKILPDTENSATAKYDTNAEIMTASAPRDSSQVNICYRIDITALQPAGYYYNHVKYTAVPTF